jgi:hypothetical protein
LIEARGTSMPCSSMLVTHSMCGSCFFSTPRNCCLQVWSRAASASADIAGLASHVFDGAGEEAAGAAGGVEHISPSLRVEPIDHEGWVTARGV